LIQYTVGIAFSLIILPLAMIAVVVDCGDISEDEVRKWIYFWYYPYMLK